MKKIVFILLLATLSLQAVYTEKVKMKSMTFVIPHDENTIVMQRNCQWCHSYGYILNQGKQSKEFWHKIVLKMKNTYKAPINPRDELLVTEYLYKHFGKEKN